MTNSMHNIKKTIKKIPGSLLFSQVKLKCLTLKVKTPRGMQRILLGIYMCSIYYQLAYMMSSTDKSFSLLSSS